MATSGDNGRTARDPWNIGFGAVVLTIALTSLFVWFPNDIKGGFITVNRNSNPEPGDAFFPTLLASLLLVLGLGQFLYAALARKPQVPSGRLDANNLRFLLASYAIIIVGLSIMYWLGPLVVDITRHLGDTDLTYRQLIDTAPYKYLGFVAGGFLMAAGLIAMAEGAIRLRALAAVAAVMLMLILVLDMLLYNIQLPPNADY